jgi:polysaccharide pyruvyl transferase WcaK-like protein
MPSDDQHVLLVNHWHDDNKGDSAITIATVAIVKQRWPGARITVASMLGENDGAFVRAFRHVASAHPDVECVPSLVASLGSSGERPGVATAMRWLVSLTYETLALLALGRRTRLGAAVAAADRLVLIGGSNLFDSGGGGIFGTFRLLQCVLPALAARRLSVSYSLFGHTLGPVKTRLGRRLLGDVVENASRVILRERLSAGFVVEELGRRSATNVAVAPDVAFVTEPVDSHEIRKIFGTREGDKAGEADPRGQGILVPRSHPYHGSHADDRLIAEFVKLGQQALDDGVVDAILVYPQCLGPTPIEDDRGIARRIANADPRFRLVDQDFSPGEVAAFLSRARFVVAVRLHAVILALTVGTPVHAVEYFTNKTRGVMSAAGLTDHWSTFEEFDGTAALDRLRSLGLVDGRAELLALVETMKTEIRQAGCSLP